MTLFEIIIASLFGVLVLAVIIGMSSITRNINAISENTDYLHNSSELNELGWLNRLADISADISDINDLMKRVTNSAVKIKVKEKNEDNEINCSKFTMFTIKTEYREDE